VVNLSNATAGGGRVRLLPGPALALALLLPGNKTSSALFGLDFGTNLAWTLRASADMKGACTWIRAWHGYGQCTARCAALRFLLACLLACVLAGPRETSERTIISSWRDHRFIKFTTLPYAPSAARRLRSSFPRWTRHFPRLLTAV